MKLRAKRSETCEARLITRTFKCDGLLHVRVVPGHADNVNSSFAAPAFALALADATFWLPRIPGRMRAFTLINSHLMNVGEPLILTQINEYKIMI